MSNYIPVPSGYERLFQGPLDPSDRFADLASLDDYLNNNGSAYKGQIVSVDSTESIYITTGFSAGSYKQVEFTSHDHTASDVTDLGTAAKEDVGTSKDNIPQVQADGKIPSSVLPSLSVGQTYPFVNDTLTDVLNNEDVSGITSGDILIADSDGTASGPVSYVFTGGNATADVNYTPISGGSTDWSNAPDASQSQSGVVELADQTETDNGTDDTRAVTPEKLKTWLLSHIFQGEVTKKKTDPDKGRIVLLGDASNGLSEHAELADVDGRIHMSGGSDFEVKGVDVGNLSDGDTFSSGTRIEQVVKQMLQKRVAPNYQSPSLNINGNGNKTLEVGTNINPTIQANWSKNNAGSLQELRFYKEGTEESAQTATPFEYNDSFQIGEEEIDYHAKVDHAEGITKDDNFGDPYPSGHILAGTVQSNTVSYEGVRRLFVGTSNSQITINSSSDVRSLSATINKKKSPQSYDMLDPQVNDEFDIILPAGTRWIVIAYPYDLGALSRVLYVENSLADITANFNDASTPSPVQQSVKGANGYTGENYRVYLTSTATGYPSQVTYRVKI